MTDITGDQVREVQWASSDEGKAQLRAAWAKAGQLGLTSSPVGHITMAEVGALLWAAREAGVPEPEPEPEPAPATGIVLVLSGCTYCHRFIVRAEDSGLPWRTLPDRPGWEWSLFRIETAVICAVSPDGRHHPPGPDSSGTLRDDPENSAALAHLQEM